MYHYKYSQFIKDIKRSRELLKEKKPSSIIGISRGGLTLAHFLAEALDIRRLFSINSISYSEKEKLNSIEIFGIPELKDEKRVLVVDDISDSGRTLQEVMRILRDSYTDIDFETLTLFYKESSIFKPTNYIHQTDEWIEFFWSEDVNS